MIEAWESKLAGDTDDAEARFAAARELAAKRGFRFMMAKEVAALPLPELLQRVDTVIAASRPGKPDMIEAAAVLGIIEHPKITLSRALALYWTLADERTEGKSSDQIRRWRNPRIKAFANLIKLIIPLAGVSLEAFRLCPEGFPRYRGKAGLTDTVNKYLRENGLLQTEKHSLYGLRHSFEDRMLAAKVDERIRRDLFGHSLGRERYGEGASLEHLMEVVLSIAL